MRRWLLPRDDPVTEPSFPIRTADELFSTSAGQVKRLPGEQSVFDLNRLEADRLVTARAARQASDLGGLTEAVRVTIGATSPQELTDLAARQIETIARDGYRIEKLLLGADEKLPLPALLFVPQAASGEAYLYLDGGGKEAASAAGGPIEQLARQGHLVLAVDLRGCGETAHSQPTGPQRRQWSKRFGTEVEPFFLAYLLGKSLVGLRTEDVLRAEKFLAGRVQPNGEPQRIHVVAVGTAAVPALHAAALAPERLATLTLRRSLRAWRDLFDTAECGAHLSETVHGALRTYDLPDLVRLVGPDRVKQEDLLLQP